MKHLTLAALFAILFAVMPASAGTNHVSPAVDCTMTPYLGACACDEDTETAQTVEQKVVPVPVVRVAQYEPTVEANCTFNPQTGYCPEVD